MSETSQPNAAATPQATAPNTTTTQATAQPTAPTTDSQAPSAEPTLLNEPAKEAPAGAPDAYADFTAPEGFTLDPEIAKSAGAIFKELNLPQAQAQKLVDFYVEQATKAQNAPFKLWRETQESWVAEVKADPAIGGKLDQVKATVSRMIDGVGDAKLASDFRHAMDFTGAGNNPAFIRMFYALAQRLTEGTHVAGRGPVEVKGNGLAKPTAAQALYPNLPSVNR